MVSGVLGEAPDGLIITFEMLFNDSDDRLLELFLEDMVFTLGVDFVEEFFLELVEFVVQLLLSHAGVGLHFLDLLLEHSVELLGK